MEVEMVLITPFFSGLHTQPFLILDLVVAKIVKLCTMNITMDTNQQQIGKHTDHKSWSYPQI
jgi:hypothetical protein